MSSDFYKAIKQQTTDAAELDAAEWHKPHTALIAELAQLHTMPATKAVCDRIDAIETNLNGWRDDYVSDLAYAYQNDGDNDAWENAEAETPSLESLIEAERDMSEAADTITDLLAALKRISRSYENQNINHVDFRVNAKNIADAAIAKAKGGAA